MDITWAMTHDADYKPLTGHDGWGQPTYSTTIEYRASEGNGIRFEFKNRLAFAKDGREIVSECQAWLPVDATPQVDDVIEYKNIEYKVINVGEKIDVLGNACYHKLYLVKNVK